MTQREALLALGATTRDAALEVLRTFAGDHVAAGSVRLEVPGSDPVGSVELPAAMALVRYTEGVTGGNLMVVHVRAARRLAAAMMGLGDDAPLEPGDEPSELELSAFGEAMNQVMASAAAATSRTLGDEVEISTPAVNVATARRQLVVGFQGATNVAVCELTLFGERCRLIQFIPQQFALLMTRALSRSATPEPPTPEAARAVMDEVMRSVPLRFSVELGRRRMRAGDAAALPHGAIVDLDRHAEDPVDVYVGGSRFGRGRLQVVDGDEWAIRLDEVFPKALPLPPTRKGVI